MVPLATLVERAQNRFADVTVHYNLFPAAGINGVLQRPASVPASHRPWPNNWSEVFKNDLPEGDGFRLMPTFPIRKNRTAGETDLTVFAMAVVFVFLVLAALLRELEPAVGRHCSAPDVLCLGSFSGVWPSPSTT